MLNILAALPTWATALIIIVIIVAFLLLVVLVWWIATANNFRMMGVKIDEANSGIDVALTKRFDLLTKSVAAVKGYAKHEAETLEKVIAMRQPASSAPIQEKADFAQSVTKAFDSLNLVVERYPELKASQNFSQLQSQITDVEEHLQAARRLYNANVSIYDQKALLFPSNIVARRLNFVKRDFFEAEAAKRADVKIEF